MNTVFLVKNSNYLFLTPPSKIDNDWLQTILGTTNYIVKHINKNICIIHSQLINTHNQKYRVSIGHILTTTVPSNFLIAQKINNQLIPLNEQQEDYIIDTINIIKYK